MITTCVGIQEQTDVAEVRRAALDIAAILQFDETSAGNLGLIVTEAARNLIKHAGGGQIILRSLHNGGGAGVELLAIDKGPGIADVSRSFADGYSTAGTPGNGLGAIARLATSHDIYTQPGRGTVLMAQVWNRASRSAQQPRPRFAVGGICVPLPGEVACGDAWWFHDHSDGARFLVVDGLGHGVLAGDAARAAVRVADERPREPGPALVDRIHNALRSTRGAALAVAEVDSPAGTVRFTGIGNIAAAVIPDSGPTRRLVSHAGTAGHTITRIGEFTYPWDSRSHLLMHSDGLKTQWSFDHYPGLLERHPSLIAGILYRDHARERDDVTVVVAREAPAGR